jgi:PAS domain S-box-containing protein
MDAAIVVAFGNRFEFVAEDHPDPVNRLNSLQDQGGLAIGLAGMKADGYLDQAFVAQVFQEYEGQAWAHRYMDILRGIPASFKSNLYRKSTDRRSRENLLLESSHAVLEAAHRQAEKALLKAGALQNAIFNSANFSGIASDEKGVIQLFNAGAERMLGYTAAEVVKKITPADISDPQEVIARAEALSLELGRTITPGFEALVCKASRGIEDICEWTYIRKNGSRVPAVVSVTALRGDQGAIIGYLLIATDNTGRRQVKADQKQIDQRQENCRSARRRRGSHKRAR